MYKPRASFDSRVLSVGGLAMFAAIIAAFVSIATPEVTAATPAAYDGASTTECPVS